MLIVTCGGFLVFFISIYGAGWLTGLLLYRSGRTAHEAIYNSAFVFAVALLVVFAVTIAVIADIFVSTVLYDSVAASLTVAGAVTGVVTGAVTGFVIVVALAASIIITGSAVDISTLVLIGMLIVLLAALQQWLTQKWSKSWFWLVYSVLLLMLSYISLYYFHTPDYMVMLLFWLVLPLVNAPLDWLSLGVTRGLLQAVRAQKHGGWRTLGWGLLDLVLALGFLFLIAAVLVVATALGNVVAGQTLVDLGAIFTELRDNPWSVNHRWVYFMLLSTLVPTLIHFALAGGAATLWLPQRLREQIADNLEQNHYKLSVAWVYLTFTPAIGFVVAPAVLLGLLYWLVTTHSGWFGGHLLNWAEWLALAVNPPVVTPP